MTSDGILLTIKRSGADEIIVNPKFLDWLKSALQDYRFNYCPQNERSDIYLLTKEKEQAKHK